MSSTESTIRMLQARWKLALETFPGVPLIPLAIALGLAGHGLRKKSLSPSGAVTALVVGFLIMAVPLRTFGVALITFYLIGSRATKIGKERKVRLEQGHAEAGYRDGWQVLSNSFTALVVSAIWAVAFAPTSLHSWISSNLGFSENISTFVSSRHSWTFREWCAVTPPRGDEWSRTLVFVVLGHFACCLGDTLASELGILSKSSPILITTFKRVPPGTNGALSLLGTTASVVGGAIMGLTFALSLFIENSACRTSGALAYSVVELVGYGAYAGLLGSGIDSLLGATIQQTRFSTDSKQVLQDHAPAKGGETVKTISGFNILTNNQVNVVSSLVTAIVLGFLSRL